MSRAKLRAARTETSNLVGNLRAEIGDILTSWVAMRLIIHDARSLESGDLATDMANGRLALLRLLDDRLENDIVARLAELAEDKIGRLNFHFVAAKFPELKPDAEAFSAFIDKEKFRDRRNRAISHKELPEQWSDHRHIYIPYRTLLQGVAHAVRLMKKIDRVFLGPAAPYLWRKARKRRYEPTMPGQVAYLLLPYLRLSERERAEVIAAELREGRGRFEPIKTKINGEDATVPAYREWGAILLGGHLVMLPEYPLVELQGLQFQPQEDQPQTGPET